MAQVIDSDWLAANATAFGGDATKGPWLIGAAFVGYPLPAVDADGNLPYSLGADVAADGTAFVATGNVAFDLNGHTVTYGNAAAPFDEGFESGTIGQAPEGWTLNGAIALIAANTGYLFGDKVLRVEGFAVSSGQTTGNTIVLRSPTITIPASGRTYTAKVACSRDGGNCQNTPVPSLKIQVCKVSDDSVVADSSVTSPVGSFNDSTGGNISGGGFRASGGQCSWKPTDTASVYIKITLIASRGVGTTGAYSDHIHLDAIRLTQSFVHGFVATNTTGTDFPGKANLPTAMTSGGTTYSGIGRFLLGDSAGTGAVSQGSGRGSACDAIFSYFHRHLRAITDTHINLSGDDTAAIYVSTRVLTDRASVTATGNTIAYPPQDTDIIFRDVARSAIIADKLAGAATISDNTFTGLPNAAIAVGVSSVVLGSSYALVVDGNTIDCDAVVTNGYAIKNSLTDNLRITNNAITGYGRGLILDVLFDTPSPLTIPPIANVLVDGNTVDIREKGNREYGQYKARAMRLRNDAFSRAGPFVDVTFSNNTFRARCGNGHALSAEGATISLITTASVPTPSTGVRFLGNTWETITEDSVATNTCKCFMLEDIVAGQDITVVGDTFKSSQDALVLADFDGTPAAGLIKDCKSVKSTLGTTGVLAFSPVRAGYAGFTVGPVTIVSHRVDTGAGLRAYAPATDTTLKPPGFAGDSGTKTILTGFSVTPHVTDSVTHAAITGAAVSVLNGVSSTDSAGVTDAGGHASLYAVTSRWTGVTSLTEAVLGPHTASASAASYQADTTSLGTVAADATPEVALVAGDGPSPLVASAGGPYVGVAGSPVTLTAAATGGVGGYTYAWDLDNSGNYETQGRVVDFTEAAADVYAVGVRATDSTSQFADASAVVTIVATPPTRVLFFATTGGLIILGGS